MSRAETQQRRRDAPSRAAAAGLAAVLLLLCGVAAVSSFVTGAAAQHAYEADATARAYATARYAAAAEESLERAYRLHQGEALRAQHRAAKDELDRAMAQVVAEGEAHDRDVAAHVRDRNAVYLLASNELFRAADGGDTATATSLERAVVDPVFRDLSRSVLAGAQAHLQASERAEQRLRRAGQVSRWSTCLAVGVGALVVGLFTRLRRRYARDSAAAARRSAHQAAHDALTGLPNRGRFVELLEAEVAQAAAAGEAVGVLLVDLDRFQEVNDTLGHGYGDALLQQVGPRLRGVLRAGEVLARLGGDEFGVLVRCPADGAVGVQRSLARRLLSALSEPFAVDGVVLTVEASAGVAVSPEHGETGEALLQHADTAMYTAKRTHEDVSVYDPSVDGYSPRKLTLLTELRGAGERGELVVHYQPLLDLGSGRVTAVEALVRWQHPREGLLGPGEFLELAEGSGLIAGLTRDVLATACRQARAWQLAGSPRVVAVNISARCLVDAALPDDVAGGLRTTGLPAALLKLEITESAVVADPVRASRVIARLHALGVGLSVDDFGTGYTSLAYLRELPVQELKIDRSFVTAMLTEPKDAAIVRTGVELARRLGLASVAEGVEDAATLEALVALGCTTAQGYHVGRPMAADRFDAWAAAAQSLTSA